jgi:hypothetical protein
MLPVDYGNVPLQVKLGAFLTLVWLSWWRSHPVPMGLMAFPTWSSRAEDARPRAGGAEHLAPPGGRPTGPCRQGCESALI